MLTRAANAQSSIRFFHGKVNKSLITTMLNMGGGGPPARGPPPGLKNASVRIQTVGAMAAPPVFCPLGSIPQHS